jgi:hypothetical protein
MFWKNSPNGENSPQKDAELLSTLVALTIIILFSEALKKIPNFFFGWRKILNLQKYPICQNENFKIN